MIKENKIVTNELFLDIDEKIIIHSGWEMIIYFLQVLKHKFLM